MLTGALFLPCHFGDRQRTLRRGDLHQESATGAGHSPSQSPPLMGKVTLGLTSAFAAAPSPRRGAISFGAKGPACRKEAEAPVMGGEPGPELPDPKRGTKSNFSSLWPLSLISYGYFHRARVGCRRRADALVGQAEGGRAPHAAVAAIPSHAARRAPCLTPAPFHTDFWGVYCSEQLLSQRSNRPAASLRRWRCGRSAGVGGRQPTAALRGPGSKEALFGIEIR